MRFQEFVVDFVINFKQCRTQFLLLPLHVNDNFSITLRKKCHNFQDINYSTYRYKSCFERVIDAEGLLLFSQNLFRNSVIRNELF